MLSRTTSSLCFQYCSHIQKKNFCNHLQVCSVATQVNSFLFSEANATIPMSLKFSICYENMHYKNSLKNELHHTGCKICYPGMACQKATKFTLNFYERHTHDHADHILSQRKVPECKICITVMSNSLQFAQRFKTLLPTPYFFTISKF